MSFIFLFFFQPSLKPRALIIGFLTIELTKLHVLESLFITFSNLAPNTDKVARGRNEFTKL